MSLSSIITYISVFDQPDSFPVFQHCDIAINWSGGLHHAKKFEVRCNMNHDFIQKKIRNKISDGREFEPK